MPIFKLFGVNILSIRLPMALLMYLNFYLIFLISRKYFKKEVVFALIILLFTDFTFINLHKIDHGPTAIETFLKLLCLYFVGKKSSVQNSLIIFSILLLGVFNKLNFIWFINALFGTYILFYFSFDSFKSISNFKEKLFNKQFLLYSILFILLVLYFVLILKTQNISPNKPFDFNQLIDQMEYQVNLMVFTLLNLRYEYLVGWSSDRPFTFLTGKAIVLIVLIANLILLYTDRKKTDKSHFQVFVLTLFISLQYFFTKEASNIWHVLLIYPFIQLVILNTISILSDKFKENNQFILGSFTTIWIVFNIYTYYNFEKKVDEKCNYWLYEPTINQLVSYTQERPERNIVSLGYGIHAQLLALDKKEKKFAEIILESGQTSFSAESAISKITDFENTVLVENLKSNLNDKRENYWAIIDYTKSKGLKMSLLHEMKDGCGIPIYNIFKISAP